MYRLTIDKFVENENHKKEMEAYQVAFKKQLDRQSLGYGWEECGPCPERLVLGRALVVDLSEEEFAAVKKAVLGVM